MSKTVLGSEVEDGYRGCCSVDYGFLPLAQTIEPSQSRFYWFIVRLGPESFTVPSVSHGEKEKKKIHRGAFSKAARKRKWSAPVISGNPEDEGAI